MRNFNFTFTILISQRSQLWVTTWGLAQESIMHVLKSTENRIHYHYLLKLSCLRRTGRQRENKPSFLSVCTSSSWCVKQKWRYWLIWIPSWYFNLDIICDVFYVNWRKTLGTLWKITFSPKWAWPKRWSFYHGNSTRYQLAPGLMKL